MFNKGDKSITLFTTILVHMCINKLRTEVKKPPYVEDNIKLSLICYLKVEKKEDLRDTPLFLVDREGKISTSLTQSSRRFL